MEEFNLWDLERINIWVNESFLKEINSKILDENKIGVEAYGK